MSARGGKATTSPWRLTPPRCSRRRATIRRVRETAKELATLQTLIDRSLKRTGPHMKAIIHPGEYSLSARLNVSLPGLDRDVARSLVEQAAKVCPYSKATHGNINVVTNIVDSGAATQSA